MDHRPDRGIGRPADHRSLSPGSERRAPGGGVSAHRGGVAAESEGTEFACGHPAAGRARQLRWDVLSRWPRGVLLR